MRARAGADLGHRLRPAQGQARPRPGAHGRRRLKNIAEPVRVYGVRIGGPASTAPDQLAGALAMAHGGRRRSARLGGWPPRGWWLWPDQPVLATQPSVAVLPFANLGGDEATGRLADGITEDIITDLSRFRELDVIAQNSTAVYKGKPADVREIGRALNVRYVLEGSIQRQGDQVRVTAQLIDATRAPMSGPSAGTGRPATCSPCRPRSPSRRPAASAVGVPSPRPRAGPPVGLGRPISRPTSCTCWASRRPTARPRSRSPTPSACWSRRCVRTRSLARAWVVLAWAYGSAASRGVDPEANVRCGPGGGAAGGGARPDGPRRACGAGRHRRRQG